MPIDDNLFRDDATRAEHRAALESLRAAARSGALDHAALLDALRTASSAAACSRVADALRTNHGALTDTLGRDVAALAAHEPEAARRLALLSILLGAGGLEHVTADTVLYLQDAPESLPKLPYVLEAWCGAHSTIPSAIAEWVLQLCEDADLEHPNLERLAAWLVPSAERMLDVAAWEAGARGVEPDLDHGGIDTVRRAIEQHGTIARAALEDARTLEAPPETHAVLEEWRTELGA